MSNETEADAMRTSYELQWLSDSCGSRCVRTLCSKKDHKTEYIFSFYFNIASKIRKHLMRSSGHEQKTISKCDISPRSVVFVYFLGLLRLLCPMFSAANPSWFQHTPFIEHRPGPEWNVLDLIQVYMFLYLPVPRDTQPSFTYTDPALRKSCIRSDKITDQERDQCQKAHSRVM